MKPLRIAVVMDPIEDIKPRKDTTLAMLLAAQRRDWEIHYLEMSGLWLRDGVAMGRAHPISVREHDDDWFARGEAVTGPLGGFDAILMRKDPPFDTEYI
jgi:glutathione synthase